MAVNLSLFAGAGAQFFDNSGNPLSGGLVYTYAAGTTTPQTSYTTSAGNVAHANPIVLDSAGRVPSGGEIWLTDAVAYKFVLQTSTAVLIATYDNVTGNASGMYAAFAAANGATLIGYTTPTSSVVTVASALTSLWTNPGVVLSSNRTYYVRTDGSNANTGLVNNAGGAFLTIQKAIDTVYNINFNSYDVTIQVADGTYTSGGTLTGNHFGGGNLYIYGNLTTYANCIVSVSSGDCFTVQSAQVTIKGFKLISSTGSGIVAYTNSSVNSGNMDFGTCGSNHVEVGTGGSINLSASYNISGGAVGHLHCGSFGYIGVPSTNSIVISGTPAFSSYFIGVAQGTVSWGGPNITGTATGPKFLAHNGGLIVTPQSFSYSSIPGSTAGTMNAVGFVVGSVTESVNFAPDVGAANSLKIQSITFNTQTYNDHFVTTNTLFEGTGNFYCNGTDSYSTGRTNFCVATATDVTTGTTDGATFSPSGFTNLQMSNNSLEALRLRRRTTDGAIAAFYRDTTNVGSISVSTTATAYNTSSDYRLKENIAPMQNALTKIDLLKPVTFRWKTAQIESQGFIAHELQDVFPEAVSGKKDAVDKDGNPEYQAIDTSFIIATLTKAVQELSAKVTDLQSIVARLDK